MRLQSEPDWKASGAWRDEDLWAGFAAAAAGPGRNATIRDERGALSAPDLLQRALQIAGALRAAGVAPGEAVLVQSRNSCDAYAALLAGFSQGIVSVPLPPMFSAAQLAAVATSGGARALIQLDAGGSVNASALLAAVPELKVAWTTDPLPEGADARLRPWTEVSDMVPVAPAPQGPDADTLVLYSSGSTGAPKGVVHSGNSLRYAAEALAKFHEVTPQDRILVALEFGFVGGTVLGGLLGLLTGADVVLMQKWDAESCLRLISEHRCTYTLLMPTHCYDVMNHPRLAEYDTCSLSRAIMAGATPEQRRAAAGVFCGVPLPMYGMSESMAHCTCAVSDPEEMRNTTDGRTLPGTELRILDDEGNPVAPGGIGRVSLRGPQRLRRYQARPELNAQVLDTEGWFDTGDRAKFSEGGYMTFQGRASEVIRRGGIMIQPAEIEAAFRGLSGVAEVAVIGIPDERLGERACACILPKGPAPDVEAMRRHLEAAGLPRYQWPEMLLEFGEFPRTPSLKIRRADLAQQARSRLQESQSA